MQDTSQVRLTLPPVPGHSGASIIHLGNGFLRKKGDQGVGVQGAYMARLAEKGVGPDIMSLGVSSYDIRLLQPLSVTTIWDAFDIAISLTSRLWEHPPIVHNTSWIVQLNAWMIEEMPEIAVPSQLLSEVYEAPGRPVLIHGDPTLCNLMQNEVGKPYLIDARVPEGKVPSFAEVDVGKILQSAWGWERIMNPAFPSFDTGEMINRVIDAVCGDSQMHRRRCFLWAAVHLSRIRYREDRVLMEGPSRHNAQRLHQAHTRRVWCSQGIMYFLNRLVSA